MAIMEQVSRFEGVEERILEKKSQIQFTEATNVILVVMSGTAQLNGYIPLINTSIFIGNLGLRMELKNEEDQPFVYRIYRFQQYKLRNRQDFQLTYELSKEYVNYNGLVYHKSSNKVRKVSEALYQANKESEQAHLLYKLLFTIEEEFKLQKSQLTEVTFQSVLDYVSINSNKPLKRDEVANHFGYHQNYFSKLIKAETGWSFSDYLAHIRLDKAKVLLLDSSYTITEVSRKIGYQDSLYFSRKFRKQTGLSPTEFRLFKGQKRIFTFQFTGDLLAAGIQPVGTLNWPGNIPPHFVQELGDAFLVPRDDYPTIEQLKALDVDLIIAPSYLYTHPKLIEELEKIAPVFILKWDRWDRLEEAKIIAKLLGREEETASWIARYKEKVVRGKELLKPIIEVGETVGVFELRENNQVGVWRSSARGAYNIYKQLELKAPKSIEEDVLTPHKHLVIDEYLISSYVADHMLVIVHTAEQGLRLKESKYWEAIRMKYHSKVYILQLEDFWASEGVFLEHQLDIQVKKLAEGDYIL